MGEAAHRSGHWVILNNVHLMPRWLKKVEKLLDEYASSGSHENFRVFMSSDPSNSIPIGIPDRSIKLTSDPPSGLKANIKQAFCTFSREEYEELEGRTRGILFGLCHFHAVMLERRKFGAQGRNMHYPFAVGDLINSASVLRNYMENAPNAEIGFRTDQSEQLCLSILDLGAGDEASGEEGASKQTVAESALQDILENHRDALFDIDAVLSLLDEPGPYHTV